MNVRVVNMIPQSRSGETNQDSEPHLAIDPTNVSQLVGTAFTPDPANGPNAPIYVSVNGGNTWVLNSIVPGNGFAGTGDITVAFGESGTLYAGTLRGGSGLRLNILRAGTFTAPNLMTVLVDRTVIDQPFVRARSFTGQDRVQVAYNNLGVAQSATVERSLDAATAAAPAGFQPFGVEPRATAGQDGPSVRPAIHQDGTSYVAYFGYRAIAPGPVITTDIVVARDDNWGTGPNQWQALTDPGDNQPGVRVATGVTINWFSPLIGQERVGSDLTLAVDPGNSSNVWLAWCDHVGGTYTIHVRRSTNRGQAWSADLRTITNAKNPALAVASDGRVGLLYQQVASGNWVTHLELTMNAWTTPAIDTVLATVPSNAPARVFFPYIGDYVCLLTVGADFYGVFCANNAPDLANFPNGVTYQRNANFATKILLANDNVTPVATSIDPFFFQVTPVKHWKELKQEIKELKEFKEWFKEQLKDIKEIWKERKEGLKERKELKEWKEKELEKKWKEKDKDIYETIDRPPETDPWRLLGEMARRLDRLEGGLARPFIRREERPPVGDDLLKDRPPAPGGEGDASRRRKSGRPRG